MNSWDAKQKKHNHQTIETVSSKAMQKKEISAMRVCFNRHELNQILSIYGRKVSSGEWRDYALDLQRDKAIFSIFRRSSEIPLYRIEKSPKLARRQGAFSVITQTGMILKRGHSLTNVLRVFNARPYLIKG